MSQFEHGQESLGTDESQAGEPFLETADAAARCPEAVLLFASGVLSALGGVFLAATSDSWGSLGAINQRLAEMGLTAGPLLMGGLVLLGLGMSVRSQTSRAAASGKEPQGELVLEQLATDLVRVRGALGKLDQRFVGLARATQGLGERVREQRQSAAAPAQESRGQGDALWRIAASLDQLGARFDRQLTERVQALEDRVLAKLEDMQGSPIELEASEPALEQQHTSPQSTQLESQTAPFQEQGTADPATAPEITELVAEDSALELRQSGDLLSDLDGIGFLQEPTERGPHSGPFGEPEAALPVEPAPATQGPTEASTPFELPGEEHEADANNSDESEPNSKGTAGGFEFDLDLDS